MKGLVIVRRYLGDNMQTTIPEDHGLSDKVLGKPELLPEAGLMPLLTDIQFEALEAGVARGESVLVSAPTSTGKTLIGWWTVASAIEAGHTAVYLVSHRALAKQKFEEAKRLFLNDFLENDRSAIVCATGDSVEDAAGRKTNAPLSSVILVATYEKFLGCLSVGGPPRDLTNICFVCDEVQLVGDKQRGQNAELLLTLMRRAGWRQFVGLSAVLSPGDGQALANWLGIRLLRNPNREKVLTLECRTSSATLSVSSGPGFEGLRQHEPANRNRDVTAIVGELLQQKRNPVIVFCMKIDDTYDFARAWAQNRPTIQLDAPAGVDIEQPLLEALRRRTAYHNAELTEDERLFVEDRLAMGGVDVVFATSTLAAGVNFPLGSAAFASWKRWDFDRRMHVPIDRAEFQNMAGRVGRMGQAAAQGHVVLVAEGIQDTKQAQVLMDLSTQSPLGLGITPEDFGTLTLQVFAGKLCTSREDAFDLIGSTLTASRERERNRSGIDHWRDKLFGQIDRLVDIGCLIELHGQITVTTFGVAVAQSGLKPETAMFFIEGLKRSAAQLTQLIDQAGNSVSEDDFAFVLSHAAIRSPEFNIIGGKATRKLNWRIGQNGPVPNPYATRLNSILFDQPWVADAGAANGALQLTEWAAGTVRGQIERIVAGVRLGTVQGVARDVSWVLTGVSEIIASVTSPTLADESKPVALRGDAEDVQAVRRLARAIRRQSLRLGVGVPSDVLWMSELRLPGLQARLRRDDIMSLRRAGLCRPLDLMDGSDQADERRRIALGLKERGGIANLIRNAARAWRQDDRAHSKTLHLRRADRLMKRDQIAALYEKRGTDLEHAFSISLAGLGIPCQALDQTGRQGYPDFLVSVENYIPIVVEVKSKISEEETVPLNAATEVLAASELAGLRNNPCVTLCSPGVDPSVPTFIEAAKRLSVVDISDLSEAILRLHEGTLTRGGFYNWLTTPGVALAETLPSPATR
ncbi:DEAD/DEAH box helicase [Mesorhizobium sp. LSHC416B00]|nr:DEAD/DEAH box helicase [Mesorhizobium sp. LSHC424B00]ESX65180.1 DEAD/DEAH box helicase [Mesorhizobium sp. LSHC416B00]